MGITKLQIEQSRDLLVGAGATKVLIFGSAAESPDKARDLDLACEGIPAEQFYQMAGRLSRLLGIQVDLVDLGDDPRFTSRIQKQGRVLHGH